MKKMRQRRIEMWNSAGGATGWRYWMAGGATGWLGGATEKKLILESKKTFFRLDEMMKVGDSDWLEITSLRGLS